MADGIKKISENVIIDKRALVVTDPNELDNDAISIGALKSDATNKGLKIKTSKNTYSLFDAEHFIMPGSITTDLLKDKCVTEIKLADNSVSTIKIQNDAVTELKIADNSISTSKLQNGAVNEFKIADDSLKNSHYKDNSITNNKLADLTIEGNKIKDLTISTEKLADQCVTSFKIADNSILNKHLTKECVSNENLQKDSVFGDRIKNFSIQNQHLATNSVNTNNILNGAITSLKIADDSIRENHLSESSVSTNAIANNAVTTNKLADNSVTTPKLADKSVTKEKLAIDVVDLIGDPVMYNEDNNVNLRKDLTLDNGNISVPNGTVTAKKIYNAVFMDIAEAYDPKEGEVYNPGDIVQLNEEGTLERADLIHAAKNFPIVGIVSDEYACCYGATEEELEAGTKIAVGLIGKVHVNVTGPIRLGDKVGLYKDGCGASVADRELVKDYIIGKALESNDESGVKKVLCLIYPN